MKMKKEKKGNGKEIENEKENEKENENENEKVLWRQRFKHWNCKHQFLWLIFHLFVKKEIFTVINVFVFSIADP